MTIMSIAGHVSKHMLERYSRIRVEAKAPLWRHRRARF
jgi:hypothetical protein